MPDEVRIPLRCSCGRLAAYMVIEDGKPSIEVLSRHDGNKHVTLIPWNMLISRAALDNCG